MASGRSLQIDAQFPEALLGLFEPRRYKVAYGGRGSAKSWSFARALLLKGLERPLRVLCAREVMRTIADSVHLLLSDQIEHLGLKSFFQVQETHISGTNGSEFLFAGLRQQDAGKIKSFEGVDIAWVEEAQALSERSLDILIPTVRKGASELWFSFNPELDTDPVYRRLVVAPPPDAWVKKVTWRDNPWFPSVLEQERLLLLERDPDAYRHVWEGEPRSVVEGAIYAHEVIRMIEERRVRPVPFDPQLPVHTVWDLGWNDQTSIILLQRLHSEVRVIEYLEASHRTLAEWAGELQQRRYLWGTDWLPHDGAHRDLRTGKSAQELLSAMNREVRIVPKLTVEEGIRAARMMFPRLYVDETKAARLLECLKRYRRNVPEATGEPVKPVHDEYSHGADAFRGLAVIVDQITNRAHAPQKLNPHRRLNWRVA
ncbi:MAG: PBSX family phage terminase large subunit [Betaproteobacteria bacterium]|nr:MAG: PBSX family phage terminase large subunit [Betaproteobacteria bacterium]